MDVGKELSETSDYSNINLEDKQKSKPERENGRTKQSSKFVFRVAFLLSILILLTSSATYIILKDPTCMYWTGDHYETISCDQDSITSAIPFNERVVQLKRITRLDTLTRNAIGHVWYAKPKRDSTEFFTDSGEYPFDRRKRLLPVTKYMLDKYVFSKRTQQTDNSIADSTLN